MHVYKFTITIVAIKPSLIGKVTGGGEPKKTKPVPLVIVCTCLKRCGDLGRGGLMGDGNTDLSPEREENNADASNGIGDDKVHIFVSHKSEDKKIALEIKKQLCRYAADRIEVYCSEEIEPGDDWLTWIKTKVCKSNLLLLLFTDPSASWDWCLFEAGLFLELTGDKFKRVVCLHHPNTDPPKPLMNLQTLPAEEELLIEFLKLFYGGTELMGLNTVINEVHANDEDEINRQAKKIIKLFAPANYSRWYPLRRLVLSLPKSPSVGEVKVGAVGALLIINLTILLDMKSPF